MNFEFHFFSQARVPAEHNVYIFTTFCTVPAMRSM